MKIAVASLASQPRKNACPAPGKMPMISATGANPSRTSATTWARMTASDRKPSSATAPSAPSEHDDRERQPLERAAGLLDVDRRRVGLVDAVAGELRLVRAPGPRAARRTRPRARRSPGAGAGSGARSRRSRRCPRSQVVAADVARRVVRADGPREAVLVEPVGVDAVAQAAELEHHPRLVDERLEQVVGDLALGLLGVVERAAGWRPTGTRARACSSSGSPRRSCAPAGRRRTARSARTATDSASAPAVSV